MKHVRNPRRPIFRWSPLSWIGLAAFLASGAVDIQGATTIPASNAAPSGSVNTSERGFLINIHQLPDGVQRSPRHDLAEVERQLAGEIINPNTGEPYPNDVDDIPGPEGDGIYLRPDGGLWVVPEVINFNQETDPFFGGEGNAGNFTPDAKFPGIPGFGNSQSTSPPGTDDFALEALAFLELAPGIHRLGVNSDDGFQFSIGVGTNTKDAFAIQPEGAAFLGSRGPADTEWDIEILEQGLYPMRLVYWEGGGGASVEFYSVQEDGTKILVNDPNNPNAIKAYRRATTSMPSVVSISPAPRETGVFPRPSLRLELTDADRTVQQNSVKLLLDGTEVPAQVNKAGGTTTVSYDAPDLLAGGSTHTATLQFEDSAGTARAHSWEFTVSDFYTLPATYAYPLDSHDANAPGFAGSVHQARVGAGIPATVVNANAQIRGVLTDPLSGDPLANEASVTTFTEPEVVNYEEEQRNNGQFTDANGFPDEPFPGIPGTGGHDNQFALELVTYLELSEGLHILGVTAQDGFQLSTGADARDVFDADVLGSAEGTQAEPVEHIIVFLAEQDGLYPFRLLHFESHDDPIVNFTIPTDGAALEWYSIDPDGYAADPSTAERILINDRSEATAIRAWRQVTAPGRVYVKSVFPPPGSSSQRTTSDIEAVLVNLGADTVSMRVNGETVTPSVDAAGNETTVTYTPDVPFERDATVNVVLEYGGVSNQWSFTTSSGELVILVTNVGEKQSDLDIKRRFEQVFGFDVLILDDDAVDSSGGEAAFTIADAEALGARLVYVSSPVNSNKAGAQPWHSSGIPLINVEQADVDNFQYGSSGGIVNPPPATVTIVNPDHPMAAGFPEGPVTYIDLSDSSAVTGIHQAGVGGLVAEPGVEVVALVTGSTTQAALVAVEKETFLLDGSTNPARIVHLGITGDDQFRAFTSDGLKLFDAAVAWAMEIEPPASEPPAFEAIFVNANGAVVLSWTGTGELYEATQVEGPYTQSANQNNPQMRTPDQDRMFFRLQQ